MSLANIKRLAAMENKNLSDDEISIYACLSFIQFSPQDASVDDIDEIQSVIVNKIGYPEMWSIRKKYLDTTEMLYILASIVEYNSLIHIDEGSIDMQKMKRKIILNKGYDSYSQVTYADYIVALVDAMYGRLDYDGLNIYLLVDEILHIIEDKVGYKEMLESSWRCEGYTDIHQKLDILLLIARVAHL